MSAHVEQVEGDVVRVDFVIAEAVAYSKWCGFTLWQAGLLSLGLNTASYLSGALVWPYVLA